jgi:hypothetical protein
VSDRILVVGFEAEGERIDRAEFGGEAALDGYAMAVVDPAAACALWADLADGSPADAAGRAEAAERAFQVVQRRRREATELVRRGGCLACLLRPVGPTLRVQRPGPQGTRSAVLHAYAWLPEEPSLARLIIVGGAGQGVRPADESHAAWRLLRSQGEGLRPVACAAAAQVPPHWHPIAEDDGGRLLAFEVRVGQGRVLFLPPLGPADPRERGRLLEGLLPARGEPGAQPSAPLDWVAGIQLPGQAELAARVAELAQQVEALEREFVDVRRRHARLERINALLSARTAGELVGPASAVFRLLGFAVETADAASLLVSSEEGSALVVLTAAEEAVSSDVYWDLVHRMDDGPRKVAKGIIVANGFCSLPPDQRGIVFPDLLRRGAIHREVCLVETTELHRACAALLAKPGDEGLLRRLRRALLETTGPCFLSQLLSCEGGRP